MLILNPYTIVCDRAIEKLAAHAERQPEAGVFSCRVLNPDGSYQRSAYPCPTVRSYLVAGLYLRWLGHLSDYFMGEYYTGWQGTTEREIGFQAGCCLLIRGALLKRLGGFDERLFFQFEDADLCFRVKQSGSPVLYYPSAEIIHIGGHKRGNYPLPVVIETQHSCYRLFYKHYRERGSKRIRWVLLICNCLRLFGYSLLGLFNSNSSFGNRIEMHRKLIKWHWEINPIAFVKDGTEPDVGYKPLTPEPKM